MQAICTKQSPAHLVDLGLIGKTTVYKTDLPAEFLASLPENLQVVLARTIREIGVEIQEYTPAFTVDGSVRLKWLHPRGEYHEETVQDLAGVLRWLVALEATIEAAKKEVESWIAQKEEEQARAVISRDLVALRALTKSGCVYANGPYTVSWYMSQETKEIMHDLAHAENEARYAAQEVARVAEHERKRWAREKRLMFISRVLAAMGDVERIARLDRGFLPMAEFNHLVHAVVLEDLYKLLVPDSVEFCACGDPVKLDSRSFRNLRNFEGIAVRDPWSAFFKVEVMAHIDEEKSPVARVTISDASGESDWFSTDCYYL